jgi:hypothetical protein
MKSLLNKNGQTGANFFDHLDNSRLSFARKI